MEVTIGKNTIGDNNKMKTNLRNYKRSTHDMSYIWRNTQAPGTLVPFMSEVTLKGDTHDIKLEASVLTHPTVGPLFGSFKLQMDIFNAPIRLYHGWLHNNKLNIGLDMAKVKLPQLQMNIPQGTNFQPTHDNEFPQISSSCLLAYLGLRGWGNNQFGENIEARRNGLPVLMYWDIFKNYYANRQEKDAYYIGNTSEIDSIIVYSTSTGTTIVSQWYNARDVTIKLVATQALKFSPKQTSSLKVRVLDLPSGAVTILPITDIATKQAPPNDDRWTVLTPPTGVTRYIKAFLDESELPRLISFPLNKIDQMREDILYHNSESALLIGSDFVQPIGDLMKVNPDGYAYAKTKQFGLALKTYNSDIMNNWINTDWIDGTNGINAITKISTTSGGFNIDTLNLANKVYNMLNRVAISGGSYQDWLNTVYENSGKFTVETPMFEGGASQEIAFQEVVSNAATSDEPLGSLAGRGKLIGAQNGGTLHIKVDEPGYLIGIVSITPRIDYNQGNRFDTLFKTMNDLHKPALDGIGFQDLITDKMAWWDTLLERNAGLTFRTVGKQPAWLDYMTNYNRTFGGFAEKNNEAFMVLNRNYELSNNYDGQINDLTTYIDPGKFNYIFADTSLSAMNFWVQIKVDWKCRRLISAKEIPNL